MPTELRLRRVRLELRTLFALALPMMIAQLASTAMGFVDTVMAGRVSPHDLAAVALGNSIWVPVYLLVSGITLATTPNVAQRFGAVSMPKSARWCARLCGWAWVSASSVRC